MDYEENEKITTEKILNPSVGDRFHEMLSFWMYVVKVEYDNYGDVVRVYTMSFNPPCEAPRDGELTEYSVDGFRKHFFYGIGDLIETSWLTYCDNRDVSGWFDGHLAEGKEMLIYETDILKSENRFERIIA